MQNRSKEILGGFLAGLGVLFLLINIGLVPFGWDAVWPVFPFLAGVFVFRLYAIRRRPADLFAALVLTQLGVFFLIFSVGIASWSTVRTLWPFFFLIPGIALLAVGGARERAASALIVGLVAVAVSVVGFWIAGGNSGVLAPLVRFWPVVLVVAGAMVFLRARRGREGAGGGHHGETGEEPESVDARPQGTEGPGG